MHSKSWNIPRVPLQSKDIISVQSHNMHSYLNFLVPKPDYSEQTMSMRLMAWSHIVDRSPVCMVLVISVPFIIWWLETEHCVSMGISTTSAILVFIEMIENVNMLPKKISTTCDQSIHAHQNFCLHSSVDDSFPAFTLVLALIPMIVLGLYPALIYIYGFAMDFLLQRVDGICHPMCY